MKKIINGKTYNTETATYLGDYTYLWPGDFHYYSEKLYQTKKGNFFLSGKGGAASPYAQPDGHGRTSGEDIKVLSEADAKYWVERHLSADDYCQIFGEPEEA